MNSTDIYSEAAIRPLALSPGDTLGIVAPASPFDSISFEKGVSVLESLGFNIHVPEEIFQRNTYLAGSDRARADLLIRMLTDSTIQGVICARGGFGSMKLLPLINYDYIKPFSKVFIGFSDITALLVNLVARCQWVVFHGPTVTSLGNSDPQSLDMLRQAVSRAVPLTFNASRGRVIAPGYAVGPLMAGNLTTLCHLVGTPYMPNLEGAVLLIEDRGEMPYRIDRMLTQMKLAGSFKNLAGLALGSFTECGEKVAVEGIVEKVFYDCPIPILSGFEVGHDQRNLTLPLGLNAALDTQTRTLRIQSVATSS